MAARSPAACSTRPISRARCRLPPGVASGAAEGCRADRRRAPAAVGTAGGRGATPEEARPTPLVEAVFGAAAARFGWATPCAITVRGRDGTSTPSAQERSLPATASSNDPSDGTRTGRPTACMRAASIRRRSVACLPGSGTTVRGNSPTGGGASRGGSTSGTWPNGFAWFWPSWRWRSAATLAAPPPTPEEPAGGRGTGRAAEAGRTSEEGRGAVGACRLRATEGRAPGCVGFSTPGVENSTRQEKGSGGFRSTSTSTSGSREPGAGKRDTDAAPCTSSCQARTGAAVSFRGSGVSVITAPRPGGPARASRGRGGSGPLSARRPPGATSRTPGRG